MYLEISFHVPYRKINREETCVVNVNEFKEALSTHLTLSVQL